MPDRQPESVISAVAQALQGDLCDKPIAYLLEAAAHYEATGHLHVGSHGFGVTVQFGLGKAVNAISPFQKGDEAIIDLFTWTEGPLAFEDGMQPDKVTVVESNETLIKRGLAYVADLAFLEENLISESSFLTRAGKLSTKEVETIAKSAKFYKPALLTEFYGNIYGTLNLKDAAARMDLSRSKWMSISATLLRLGLLLSPEGNSLKSPTGDAPVVPATAPLPAAVVDSGWQTASANAPLPAAVVDSGWQTATASAPVPAPAVDAGWQTASAGVPLPKRAPDGVSDGGPNSVPLPRRATDSVTISIKKSLDDMNADLGGEPPALPRTASGPFFRVGVSTDMASYGPSDLASFWRIINTQETGILSREMFLFMLSHEFATAHRFQEILTLAVFSITFQNSNDDLVPIEDVCMIIRAVEKIKRDVDLFGHFGERSFALILPRVDSARTCILVDRINERLPQMVPSLEQSGPKLHFGLASAPADAASLSLLVKVAHSNMQEAATRGLHRFQPSQ